MLLSGKDLRNKLQSELVSKRASLEQEGIKPKLHTLLIGDDEASKLYVQRKIQYAKKIGIQTQLDHYPKDVESQKVKDKINALNQDPSVHGILVQLPLPQNLDKDDILSSLSPSKDVDGLHPQNLAALLLNKKNAPAPCTARAVLRLLEETKVSLTSKNALVIGRSHLVGLPVFLMLQAKNCTVTLAHSKTKQLQKLVAQSDIVVAAIGKASFIQKEWIKPNALVIDVGINRIQKNNQTYLVGDVEKGAEEIASFLTPVPFGVGPMTIHMLMDNLLMLAKHASKATY